MLYSHNMTQEWISISYYLVPKDIHAKLNWLHNNVKSSFSDTKTKSVMHVHLEISLEQHTQIVSYKNNIGRAATSSVARKNIRSCAA